MVQHRGVDSNKLTPTHVKPGNFSSGQLVKDSSLLNHLYLVSPACDNTRLALRIGLWPTAGEVNEILPLPAFLVY